MLDLSMQMAPQAVLQWDRGTLPPECDRAAIVRNDCDCLVDDCNDEICDDGIDNDEDGATDLMDIDCQEPE